MIDGTQRGYEHGDRCVLVQVAGTDDARVKYVSSRSLSWLSTTDKQILQIWRDRETVEDQNMLQIIDKQIQAVDMRHNSPGILGWFTRFYHRFLNLFGCGLTRQEEQEVRSFVQQPQEVRLFVQPPKDSTQSPSNDEIPIFNDFHTTTTIDDFPSVLPHTQTHVEEPISSPVVSPPVTSSITGPTVKEGPTDKEMDAAYAATIEDLINLFLPLQNRQIKHIEGIIMDLGLRSIQLQRSPDSTGFRFLVTPEDGVNLLEGNLKVLFEEMDGRYYLREYVTKKVLNHLKPVVVQEHLEEKCRLVADYHFSGIMGQRLNAEEIRKKLKLNLAGLQIEVPDKDENEDEGSERVVILFNKSIENYKKFCECIRRVTNGCIVLPKFEDAEAACARKKGETGQGSPCDPNVDPFVKVDTKTSKIVIYFKHRFANLLLHGNGNGPDSDE